MDKNELFKTASLASLKLDETEAEKLAAEVTAMLDNFSLMMEADVDGLDPTTQTLQKENFTRTDARLCVSDDNSNLSNELLNRAPETEDRFIVIPNVI